MDIKTLKLYKALMKKGYISKESHPLEYGYFETEELVSEEMEILKNILEFDIVKGTRTIYLIPHQSNDLFLQNNSDFKRTAGSNITSEELYLLNYLGIYIIYLFFGGSTVNIQTRTYISLFDLIGEVDEMAKKVVAEKLEDENEYNINYNKICKIWLAKLGDDTMSLNTKNGLLLRIIRVFEKEDLFVYDKVEKLLKPTRKLIDLMPYFLGKDRIKDINNVLGDVLSCQQ